VTSKPCEVHFIDIVPVIEVQGLIIPTEMDQENKIDTIPEENLLSIVEVIDTIPAQSSGGC